MARKDDILSNFLKHEMLNEKYELKKSDIPSTVREALNSDKPIVKAIALIVDGLESPTPITDAALNTQIRQYLQEQAL
jgi:hypothetical protein